MLGHPGVSQDDGGVRGVYAGESPAGCGGVPEIFIVRGLVARVMRPSRCPLRELATSGLDTSTSGTPHWAAMVASRKLSSASESSSAKVFQAHPGHSRMTGRQVRRRLEESSWYAPSDPRFTSGHALLPDTGPRSGPSHHSENTPSPAGAAHAPPVRPGNGPPSWPQTRLWGAMVGNDGPRSGTIGVAETVGVMGRGAAEAGTWLASLTFGPPDRRLRKWLGR